MSSSTLAWRLFSSSATSVRRSTGTHLHRIDGFSLLQQSSRAGDKVISKPFHVGGRRFQLFLYPNGIDSDHRGFVSADLKLDHGPYRCFRPTPSWRDATATYRVSILDGAGGLAHSRTVGPCRFHVPGSYYDRRWREDGEDQEAVSRKTSVDELVAAEELRRSVPFVLGEDDCLKVQCDVSVVNSDRKWWHIN